MIRVATEADKDIYENKMPRDLIVPGDLIVDSPNNDSGEANCYFIPKMFPEIREGASIWADGDRIGENVTGMIFRNGPKDLNPWHIKTATFKPIPGTTVRAPLEVHGLQEYKILGSSPQFPGLPALNDKKFLSGNFGFHFIQRPDKGHCLNISALHNGKIYAEGFEMQDGFSGMRLAKNALDFHNYFEAHNFFLHDIDSGEGPYLGNTSSDRDLPKLTVKLYDFIIARTAAEGLQLQHSIESEIRNGTIYCADTRWMAEFGKYQDSGIQIVVDKGKNILKNVMLDGFAGLGLNLFGSDRLQEPGEMLIEKFCAYGGRYLFMYPQKSMSYGINWKLKDVYTGGYSTDYTRVGNPNRNYFIDSKQGSDNIEFENFYFDDTLQLPFKKSDGFKITNAKLVSLPPPKYINSGFSEPSNKISQWHQHYKAQPVSAGGREVATEWFEGDIAIDHLANRFYKCRSLHTATDKRPNDNDNFYPLCWDINGIRNDQFGFDGAKGTRYDPPNDLRPAIDSMYRNLGIGYTDEETIVEDFYRGSKRITITNKGTIHST